MLFQGHPIQSSIPLSPIPFCSAYLPTSPLTTGGGGGAATLAVGEADAEARVARKGAAFSLGQVKGKFAVNLDFETLVKGEKGKARKKKGKGKNMRMGKEKIQGG